MFLFLFLNYKGADITQDKTNLFYMILSNKTTALKMILHMCMIRYSIVSLHPNEGNFVHASKNWYFEMNQQLSPSIEKSHSCAEIL